MLTACLAFAVAVLPTVLSPGVSFALTSQRVLLLGPAGALTTIGGTLCGLYVHATAATLGLSALVAQSATAFTILKVAGAAYLVALGAVMLRRSRRDRTMPLPRRAPVRLLGGSPFTQALLGNVLNPKAATLYLTFVPQFVSTDRAIAPQMAMLATVHAALLAGWLAGVTLALTRARHALDVPRLRRRLDTGGGWVLIVLGVRTAVQARA